MYVLCVCVFMLHTCMHVGCFKHFLVRMQRYSTISYGEYCTCENCRTYDNVPSAYFGVLKFSIHHQLQSSVRNKSFG